MLAVKLWAICYKYLPILAYIFILFINKTVFLILLQSVIIDLQDRWNCLFPVKWSLSITMPKVLSSTILKSSSFYTEVFNPLELMLYVVRWGSTFIFGKLTGCLDVTYWKDLSLTSISIKIVYMSTCRLVLYLSISNRKYH